MNNVLDGLANILSKSLNELDIKISHLNIKLNKLNKHLVYIYLLLLLNCSLNFILLLK